MTESSLRLISGRSHVACDDSEMLLVSQTQVLEMIMSGSPLGEILGKLCSIAECQAGGALRAIIFLADPNGKYLRIAAAPSLTEADIAAIDGIPVPEDWSQWTAATAQRGPIVTSDIAIDPRWISVRRFAPNLAPRAAWSVPILAAAGTLLGTLDAYINECREPTSLELKLCEVLARLATLAIERQRSSESEARYRAMVEASPECVKLVRADGTLLRINATGLSMIEAADEAVVRGSCVYDLIAPEHREQFRLFNERICQGGTGTLEFDIVGLEGTRRSMETSAVPLPAPTGGFMQLAVTRDVTSRAATERAYALNRARLNYATRLSGVGFWYCDLPFDELEWDERVKEHFYFAPTARITLDDFYARIHEEDRTPTRDAIEASIRNRTPYDIVYRTVHPITGAVKWIRALGGTNYSTHGTPTHFDGVTVDVSAQKRDQQRLSMLIDQLREQDRRKDEFLATLAHELRNPLAPIRTGLYALRAGCSPEQQVRLGEMMERQLGHLVRMVDDLLDISRVTLGKITLKKERVDFRTVLHGALETTRPLVEAAAHELAVRLPPDPLPLEVDPTRIGQVIANLVNNSAKYTPRGGRIQVAAEATHDVLIVRVSDSGLGIPVDMLPKVFDIFIQVERSIEDSHGGLGIGLALVRKLVEMHGGTVEAESPGQGQGSTFTIRLPLAAERDALSTDADKVRAKVRPSLRILIVDDNLDAAESLAICLELEGHRTRRAGDGKSALVIAAEFQPQVAILDIGLPGMDGYELARCLRSQTRPGFPPLLVAATGWGTEEDRRQAREAGFDLHLVKPIDPEKLNQLITGVEAGALLVPNGQGADGRPPN
jgi:PAS domain S-box-containing protein